MRAVIDHPRLQLVGVWVHSQDKVGQDAGALCGRPPTGVLATDDVDALLRLDADCVLYMPQGCDIELLSGILASGKNVVSSRFEFLHPPSMKPETRVALEHACAEGDTSLYGTGSSPGFVTEALPLVLLSIQREFASLTIDEFADMRYVKSPEMVFGHMGFGRPLASFDSGSIDAKGGFAQSLKLIAAAIGCPIDFVEVTSEVAGPRVPVSLLGRKIGLDSIAAQRTTVTGRSAGREILQFRANWYCTMDIDADWDLREVGWQIRVHGDAPLDVSITNPVPADRLSEVGPNKTPNRIVNAIPYVCAAPSGIRTTSDLPQIVPYLGA